MLPLSVDLRKRILEALKEDSSSLRIAKRFKVSSSVVRKLRLKVERTGKLEPRRIPGRERLVQGKLETKLLRVVERYPDATLVVLCELLEDQSGMRISETTMWRQLRRMGLTLKKRQSTPRRDTART